MNGEIERLVLLMQQCGQLIDAAGRATRHGFDGTDPTTQDNISNRELIERQAGGVLAVLDMMFQRNDIDPWNVNTWKATCGQKQKMYLHFQGTQQ